MSLALKFTPTTKLGAETVSHFVEFTSPPNRENTTFHVLEFTRRLRVPCSGIHQPTTKQSKGFPLSDILGHEAMKLKVAQGVPQPKTISHPLFCLNSLNQQPPSHHQPPPSHHQATIKPPPIFGFFCLWVSRSLGQEVVEDLYQAFLAGGERLGKARRRVGGSASGTKPKRPLDELGLGQN